MTETSPPAAGEPADPGDVEATDPGPPTEETPQIEAETPPDADTEGGDRPAGEHPDEQEVPPQPPPAETP